MGRLLSIIVLVGFAFGLACAQNVDGVWEGEIQDPKRPVVVTADFSALRVSFSGAAPVNMTGLALPGAGNLVRFEVVNGRQTLKFAGTKDAMRITGEVYTGSRRIPFWL